MNLLIRKTRPDAITPTRGTAGSSGLDLYLLDTVVLAPNVPTKIPLGIAIWIQDPAMEGQIRLRSSYGKKGIVLLNAPGTIDSDYQGEISALLMNLTDEAIRLLAGERPVQLVISPVITNIELNMVSQFDTNTARGAGGFGSTGQ